MTPGGGRIGRYIEIEEHNGTTENANADRVCQLCPGRSDINLFSYGQSNINLDV